jgi:hypothetical protein
MSETNGRWSVAFWVLTFITATMAVGSFTWTSWCFFKNGDRIESLTQVANHNSTTIMNTLMSVDKRLYRLELNHGIDNGIKN